MTGERFFDATGLGYRAANPVCRGPDAMIDIYYWATPNGHKIVLFAEETGLPYRIIPVDIRKGEQFDPKFLAISPNNRIPAIVDHAPIDGGDPLSVFESGEILLYLAEKTGRLLPTTLRERVRVLEFLFWQVSGLGPMLGQNHHFAVYATEKVPYAIERYVKETHRLYGVLDKQLSQYEFVGGSKYSIADIACYPWIAQWDRQSIDFAEFPHVYRWFRAVGERPAMIRTYEIAQRYGSSAPLSDEARRILFGQTAAVLRDGRV
jgi:GST-like protein